MVTLHLLLSLIGIWMVGVTNAENIPRVCPTDYEYYSKGRRCYKFHLDPKPWKDARQQCRAEGADLLVIGDADTNNFIKQMVEVIPLADKMVTLGLQEIGASRNYKWVDGNPLEYDNWASGEPNKIYATGPGCVRFKTRSGWDDYHCSTPMSYVCDKPLSFFNACPSRYYSYTKNEKCVKAIHDGFFTWDSARLECQSDGGDLAMIKDDEYNTFIKSLLKQHKRYWIGLTRQTAAPGFEWIDGSPLNYTQWAQNQPENSNGHSTRGEVSIIGGFDGWNDYEGDIRRISAVCEQDFYKPESCGNDNFVLNKRDKKCYKVRTTRRKYYQSKNSCQRKGGGLAEVLDDKILNYFIGLITAFNPSLHYWIEGVVESPDSCLAKVLTTSTTLADVTSETCDTPRASLCWTTTMRDGPVLECPHGYITYVSARDTGWKITCVMVESKQQKSHLGASLACQGVGGDLYPDEPAETDRNTYVAYTLLNRDLWYWYKTTDCKKYNVNVYIRQGSCSDSHYYFCKHWGNIEEAVQLRNILNMIGQRVYDSTNPDRSISLLDICRTSDMNALNISNTWIQSTSNVFVFMERSLDSLVLEKPNIRCMYKQQTDCCVDVTFSRPSYVTNEHQLKMSLSYDKLECLCPSLVTPEIIGLLDNFTNMHEDQNSSSSPPNKLCPCSCDKKNVNYNPSRMELSLILTRIEDYLKVDTVTLSSRRHKKISAPDSRTESRVFGYVGVLLCLIPVCLLVAMDLIRVVQFFQRNNQRDTNNTMINDE